MESVEPDPPGDSPTTQPRPELDPKGCYKNFGSFFTDNVELMVEAAGQGPTSGYVPPPLPFDSHATALLDSLSDTTPLGVGLRPMFLIDFKRWTYINHGAFGGVCRPAFVEAEQWRQHCETQPLTFLDRELFPQVIRVMAELAGEVKARPQDLVFLPNATSGLNTVIRSLDFKQGDVLYMLDIGYGSVKKMAQAGVNGEAEVVYGHVELPISGPEAILDVVSSTLPANTKLAVFDSITSNTAVVLPIKALVDLCHQRNIKVLIDAAHAPGQLEVDLTALDADFYVANCHKWMAGPRGSAFMWAHPSSGKALIKPLTVSHGSGCGFTSDFIWDGCRDYAPYLAVSSALHFWRTLGSQRCMDYMRCLVAQAVDLLVGRWGTDTIAPLAMCASMALVRLPAQLHDALCKGGDEAGTEVEKQEEGGATAGAATSADAKYVQDLLHYDHAIECPVKCHQGLLYVRLSCAVYNCIEDYEALATAIAVIMEKVGCADK